MNQDRVKITELEGILSKETSFPWVIYLGIMEINQYEISNSNSNL
jgi:hypothetical protein